MFELTDIGKYQCAGDEDSQTGNLKVELEEGKNKMGFNWVSLVFCCTVTGQKIVKTIPNELL